MRPLTKEANRLLILTIAGIIGVAILASCSPVKKEPTTLKGVNCYHCKNNVLSIRYHFESCKCINDNCRSKTLKHKGEKKAK
jgi:hypothetical protein